MYGLRVRLPSMCDQFRSYLGRILVVFGHIWAILGSCFGGSYLGHFSVVYFGGLGWAYALYYSDITRHS